MTASAVSGCGAGGGNSAQGLLASNQADSVPVTPATTPSPERAKAQQALDFVASRLRKLDLASGTIDGSPAVTWNPASWSFKSGKWTWREDYSETAASAIAASSLRTSETYTVDPRELSYPVQVSSVQKGNQTAWAVDLECASSKCFHIAGEKVTSSMLAGQDSENRNEAIKEDREQNLWYFMDERTARRAAKALEVVIAYEGGSKQDF